MNTLRGLVLGSVSLVTSGAAWAQNGGMMGGHWGNGWMGSYGGVWMPVLVVAVVIGVAVLVFRRK